MTNIELKNILERLVNEPTVYYSVAGGDWAKWNGSCWNMDCVCMIKSILWGFNFDKNASHGGAVYGSNGVYDDTADDIINRCYNISTDFSKIEVGELLHMDGHVGIYVGNGKVIEATSAWDYKVQKSDISKNGARSRNGQYVGYWKEHGKLQYVNYINETKKSNEEVARDVIEGLYGNMPERKINLENAGYKYEEVQKIVNDIINGKRKSNEEVAREVIEGIYGNMPDRKINLENAGYNYEEVQRIVNEMMR